MRKAQYSFSWDWGPKLTTSGIWRDISLCGYSGGKLTNPFVKIISIGKREAVVEISVDVTRLGESELRLSSVIEGPSVCVDSEMTVTKKEMKYRVNIPDPELWWPNGYGAHPMYRATFTLLEGRKEVHRIEVPFALRSFGAFFCMA